MTSVPPTLHDPRRRAIRIGVMSDVHIEAEPVFRAWTHRRASQGDCSAVAEVLQLWQDLGREPGHPEGGPDLRRLKAEGIDLLLFGGDVDVGTRGIDYAIAAARYLGCVAIYIAGNHEHYGREIGDNLRRLRAAADASGGAVVFLEDDRADFCIHERRIAVLGCTLWTDLQLTGDAAAASREAMERMYDFQAIGFGDRVLTPADTQAFHDRSREWLAREMPRARDEADIVVLLVHHGPIPDANPPQYRGGGLAAAFASDLRDEIVAWRPDLVTWGHTHHVMDVTIGPTRYLSAPRGYLGPDRYAELFVPPTITFA